MSMAEKKAILGVLGLSTITGAFFLIKGNNPQVLSKGIMIYTDKIIEKREILLKDKDIRMLYSSMTFFYLQGFLKNDLNSFFKLYDILSISKPQLVYKQLQIALDITKEDYEKNYIPITKHPKFKDAMKKVDYYMKIKSQELGRMPGFKIILEVALEDLEYVYLMDYCNINKCELVFQNQSYDQIQKIQQAKIKVQELQQNLEFQPEFSVQDRLETQYVDQIIKELQPKLSIFPQSPYKTIVGITKQPELLNGISRSWKQQFKNTYGHQVLEEEIEN